MKEITNQASKTRSTLWPSLDPAIGVAGSLSRKRNWSGGFLGFAFLSQRWETFCFSFSLSQDLMFLFRLEPSFYEEMPLKYSWNKGDTYIKGVRGLCERICPAFPW